ncbi:hypothetical protein BACCAP_04743 [Pseudoflavonifractor capillosus ATCC 29799]|uniref:Uncharacterized protein n=1 Tax=Pseudoflavonifractor capillosus ATCC 29799 TaxID=411467 RepID=A6P2L2_9FIRM|nr:hypothetical protein BACCAP_04743 [Pseudoflavonifractor capillosus ATCC 29799]
MADLLLSPGCFVPFVPYASYYESFSRFFTPFMKQRFYYSGMERL